MHPETDNLSTEEVPLVLTEQIANLLTEASDKIGKPREEVILACLEHGLEKILTRANT